MKSAFQTLSSDWRTSELLTNGDDYVTSKPLFSRKGHMLLVLFDYHMQNSNKNSQCLWSAYYLTNYLWQLSSHKSMKLGL